MLPRSYYTPHPISFEVHPLKGQPTKGDYTTMPGKNIESQSVGKVSFQYDCFIEDIRKLCQKSAIMISKSPWEQHHYFA